MSSDLSRGLLCLASLNPDPHLASLTSSPHDAEKVGGIVVETACVIELPFLKGREKIQGTPLFVLVEKEGA